jgi:cyclopropane fatty-acyl-phospholipid synthase-like methyltransferase
MLKNSLWIGTFLVFLSLAFYTGAAAGDKEKKKDKDDFEPKYKNTTYVPTAEEVIHKMFEMGKVNEKDVIFDLGCGDNRILYKAAKKFGCRGVGIEINPDRIREAMDQYEKYNGEPGKPSKEFGKLLSLVEVRHGDALKVKDISDATVVVMYMFPQFMDLWFPIAQEKLKPGTRILSHDYSWTTGWDPVKTETVASATRDNHKVIMWIVPQKKGTKREASK